MPDGRRGPHLVRLLVVPVLLVLAMMLAVLDAQLHRWERLSRLAQPATVEYPDGTRHYVGVVRERSRLLGRHQAYRLYAGSDPGLGHGHYVRLEFVGVDRPVLAGADWRSDGVRARFTSGHEVFVPRRYFLFGR